MVNCAVYGCFNISSCKSKHYKANVCFYSFPKDTESCNKWIKFCSRDGQINVKNARICSEHFETKDRHWNLQHQVLGYSPTLSRKVRPGAVPSLNPPEKSVKRQVEVEKQKAREQRLQTRKDKLAQRVLIKDLLCAPESAVESDLPTEMVLDEAPEPQAQEYSKETMEKEILELKEKIRKLEDEKSVEPDLKERIRILEEEKVGQTDLEERMRKLEEEKLAASSGKYLQLKYIFKISNLLVKIVM